VRGGVLQGGKGRRGFTLLEVLLALTLLAMAGAIVYSFLGTAFVSWTSGFAAGRRSQVARIAVDRLSQQLKSAVPARVLKAGKPVAAFAAADESLRFVTLLPTGVRSLSQVSYSIEEGGAGPRLVYREYPWPDKKFFEGREPRKEEILPEIIGMKVVLLARDEGQDEGEEAAEWNPDGSDFPGEVTVTLVSAGEGGGQGKAFTVTIPLLSLAVR
jgi:prepilin-type N-terminal cleavage/methylation domain-containing protein